MRRLKDKRVSRCSVPICQELKTYPFFVQYDVKKKVRIGYDDGTFSDLNILPDVEFRLFNAARIYLAIYLKNNPDEKSKNYFLHPVKSEVKK